MFEMPNVFENKRILRKIKTYYEFIGFTETNDSLRYGASMPSESASHSPPLAVASTRTNTTRK